jgi:hypothetical protein
MSEWKLGLPPGRYYEGMVDDFEVYFTVGGVIWHRRRSPEERQAWIDALPRQEYKSSLEEGPL